MELHEKILTEINQLKSLLISKNSFDICQDLEGMSLAFFYYSRWFNDSISSDFAHKLLKQIINKKYYTIRHSYITGACSSAWLMSHLERENFIKTKHNFYNSIDNWLDTELNTLLKGRNFDFLHGATGIVNYFLEKEERQDSIIKFIRNLYDSQISNKKHNHSKWEFYNPVSNQSCYNLSLSHGMSSVIIILCKCYEKGIEKELCEELITKSINFILQNELYNDDLKSMFPSAIFSDKIHEQNKKGSRLGWCYGDLGIGFALLKVYKVTKREDYYEKAKVIFLNCSNRRTFAETLVRDFAFCHGSIGLAHIFYRLYLEFNLPIFKDASDYWMAITLKMKRFPNSVSGYKSYFGSVGWKEEWGLLEGITGVFLVSSGIYMMKDPKWDQYFLLS